MITYFDKEKLDFLVKNLCNITNLTVSIYDNDFNIISAVDTLNNDFCCAVRKNPEIQKRCIKSDEKALKICRETKKAYYHHCHIGLSELAVPIVHNDITIGFMILGQSCEKGDVPIIIENTKKLFNEYNFDYERAINGINNVKYITKEYISSLSEVLKMAVEYIWLNNIIGIEKIGIMHTLETYIEKNIQEDLSISRLCKVFNISSSTLFNISKKKFGCSIQKHILDVRINLAKDLLIKGYTVSEASKLVGFADDNYFIRCFKKQIGTTPKQFQLANRKI